MEFTELQTFMFVLMSICGGVVSIAAAIAVIVRFWKWARKDTDKNTEDLEELKGSYEAAKKEYMAWFASDKKRIESLEGDFNEIIEQNNLMMRAVVAIMDHQLDGNHTDKLEEARNKVSNYLFENKTRHMRRKEIE